MTCRGMKLLCCIENLLIGNLSHGSYSLYCLPAPHHSFTLPTESTYTHMHCQIRIAEFGLQVVMSYQAGKIYPSSVENEKADQ